MRHSRILLWAAPLALFVPALWAMEDPKDKPSADKPVHTEKQYSALVREFQTAQQEYVKAVREAKTDEDRASAREKAPDPEKCASRFLELSDKAPDDRNALQALLFFSRAPGLGSEKVLRVLLEKSPHRAIQGAALVGVAQILKNENDWAHRMNESGGEQFAEQLENYAGKELVLHIRARDPHKTAEEIEATLERVADKYRDVKGLNGTLGDLADRELFEIRNLSVGKTAPDIEGEDIDGETFKLSDYRGKVVVLDFWGNW